MLSRFTEPGRFAPMLDELPDDPRAIAALARAQTLHHNLLAYFGVVGELRRIWPPRFDAILGALAETPPRTLSIERPPDRRILGACVLESHFLAGLLRHRGHRVRIRVGYFRSIRQNQEHVVAFWADVARAKGVEASHARSQLLWDLFSLLNHGAAGLDDLTGGDCAFVKRQTYDKTSPEELTALDELASLLAEQRFEELAGFYRARPELRLEGAERDPHSLVFEG
jgi:hypothetical protein